MTASSTCMLSAGAGRLQRCARLRSTLSRLPVAYLQACALDAEAFVSIVKCLPEGLQALDVGGNPFGAKLGAPAGALPRPPLVRVSPPASCTPACAAAGWLAAAGRAWPPRWPKRCSRQCCNFAHQLRTTAAGSISARTLLRLPETLLVFEPSSQSCARTDVSTDPSQASSDAWQPAQA